MLPAKISELLKRKNIFVATGRRVAELYSELKEAADFILPQGERAKSPRAFGGLLRALYNSGAGRGTTVVAVGGGAVLDAAGFAASVYMRGIEWTAVPTTLLSMADSSLGGKTGIDFKGVKNLVGSVWPPSARFVELSFLKTLPRCEFVSGWGEVVKTALLDGELYDFAVSNAVRLAAGDCESWRELIGRCDEVKMRFVGGDERDENGRRAALNIGHTVGHALEAAYKLRHGLAVMYGLGIEGKMFGQGQRGQREATRLAALTPPLPPQRFAAARLKRYLKSDKKNGSGIVVMLPDGVGAVRRVETDEAEFMKRLNAALAEATAGV